MRMRCLITGATGFVAGHLADALTAAGHDVAGLARSAGSRFGPAPFPLYAVDLLDVAESERTLRETRPEWVCHLAGFANPGRSFHDPAGAWAGNLGATQGLYQAILQSGLSPRILFVSSGLVYGDLSEGEQVCAEDTPLRPASPYAASKAAADLLSYQLTRSPGLDIVRVRAFNQIGPGQSADYAAPNFARQIAAIERGQTPAVVVTGDLGGQRDLTDVRDMVRAYIRLLEVGVKGEVYNAGCGQAYSMRDVLDRLVARSRVAVTVDERVDPARRGDTAVSRADTRKLRLATGWTPTYTLDQTLADILDDWRARSNVSPSR
jgi:GDP-4-dehydro-6-deoxy-D-mannose reductase